MHLARGLQLGGCSAPPIIGGSGPSQAHCAVGVECALWTQRAFGLGGEARPDHGGGVGSGPLYARHAAGAEICRWLLVQHRQFVLRTPRSSPRALAGPSRGRLHGHP